MKNWGIEDDERAIDAQNKPPAKNAPLKERGGRRTRFRGWGSTRGSDFLVVFTGLFLGQRIFMGRGG